MDSSKIGGFFSGKEPINSTNKADKSKNKDKEKISTNQIVGEAEGNSEFGGLFKLPPSKVVGKLSALLEKSLSDPKVEKLMMEYKIPMQSRQALAFCTYSCIKQLLGNKINLSAEDEKSLLEAIQQEYEEDKNKPLDPDERKKRKRERRKKNKKQVNALMALIEESIANLEKDQKQIVDLQF